MSPKPNQNKSFIENIRHHLSQFILYIIFLTMLFSAFTIYQRLLLDDFTGQHLYYGYSVVEALILAKIILLGESIKLGKKFNNKPLIIPVIYKTCLFCLLLFIFDTLGHIAILYLKHVKITNIYVIIELHQWNIILARSLVMFLIFLLFFSFTEIARVMGSHKLFNLFFKKRDDL